MPTIDLAFDVRGTTIPLDYGYALFSSLCRIVPGLHGDRRVGVHPVRGVRRGPGLLTLVPQSKLRLRMPSESIGDYLPIAGAALDLEGSPLRVGVPRMEPLTPAPFLASRLVTIGRLFEPEAFAASARDQLASMGVVGEFAFLPSNDPARAGESLRRVIRIKERRIVGFAAGVSGLTAEGSLLLQEKGLGSRRRMGCGLFARTSVGRFDG